MPTNGVLLRFLVVASVSAPALFCAQPISHVQVEVGDGLGDVLPAESITISHAGLDVKVRQNEMIELDYGQYTVAVDVRGFSRTVISATIDQPSQVVAVVMKLGSYEDVVPPPCSIVGLAPPGLDVVRVRAIELFGSYSVDVPLDKERRFEIRRISCGDYLLVGMGRSKLLGTMAIRSEVLPTHFELKFAQAAAAIPVK